MNVDFTRVKSFISNCDRCTGIMIQKINRYIRTAQKPIDLAVLEMAEKYYNKFRIFAIYEDGSQHFCDKDDLSVLIKNFPGERK